MNHIGLFEGIGGFSLAARWMDWKTIAWCEINPFCQKVLKHHFPKATGHEDIKSTNFTIYRGKCDILTGGFPCQPYSAAGKRLGTEDDRHLWPEMLRAIREIQPTWIVGENVRGLTNWNGGLVFDQVQIDLENEGYQVTPFLLPACAVNAPHRRDRIWFVAYNPNAGTESMRHRREDTIHGLEASTDSKGANAERGGESNNQKREGDTEKWGGFRTEFTGNGKSWTSTDTENTRCSPCSIGQREEQFGGRSFTMGARQWIGFPTQPPVCSRNDGISSRLAGITFSKHRNESIKAYGNAVVPQVVFQIFKAIKQWRQNK